MRGLNARMVSGWARLGPRFMPFADAATTELPLSRLLRLSLFQVSVGMAAVLLIGTLNRVMIVELGVPAWLVAVMVALPLIAAPFRAIVGFRSDTHRSMLGWRRVPYLWMGTMLQFGGLAIMPFALIVLSGDTTAPPFLGRAAAALAFLLVGARSSHRADGWPGAGDRPGTSREAPEGGGVALHDAAAWHGVQCAVLWRPAAALLRASADPGGAGICCRDGSSERDCLVEAGAAKPGANLAHTCAAQFLAVLAGIRTGRQRHAPAGGARLRGLSPSACRMSSWSLTGARYCILRWDRRPR